MAGTAMSTNRHGITYGRRVPKHTFSNDFENLTIKTPQKPRPHVSKLQISPTRSARAASVDSADGNVFDVPLSDDEDVSASPTPRPSPVKAAPSKPIRSPSSLNLEPRQATKAPDHTVPASNHKRKRSTPGPASKPPSRASTPYSSRSTRSTRNNSVEPAQKRPAKGGSSRRTTPSAPSRSKKNAQHATNSRSAPKTQPLPERWAKGVAVMIPTTSDHIMRSTEDAPRDIWDIPDDTDPTPLTPARKKARMEEIIEEPSTPDMALAHSPAAGPRSAGAKVTTTPRQAQLWSDLLADDDSISESQRESSTADAGHRHRPSLNPPRVRLIDTLKAPEHLSGDLDSSLMEIDDKDQSVISVSQDSQLAPSAFDSSQTMPSNTGPKITYAQQRSFLDDPAQSLDELLSQPLDLDESLMTTKAPAGKPTSGLSANYDDDDDDDGNTGRAMKSIHELRAAGDERRFDDDMSTLIDDISNKATAGISAKRAALLDLTSKLDDASFKSRFVGKSLEFDVLSLCTAESDAICGSALGAAVVRVLLEPFDPRSAQLILEAKTMSALTNMLEYTKDVRSIARDRITNMARIAQSSVADMASSLGDETFWNNARPKTISPQLVSLRAIEMLVRRLRETGCTEAVLNEQAVEKMLRALGTIDANPSQAKADPAPTAPLPLKLVLSALESASVAPACALNESIWTLSALDTIAVAVDGLLDHAEPEFAPLRSLALRLCLNLANNSQRNSDAFAKASLLGKLMRTINSGFSKVSEVLAEDGREGEFDELLLGLGALFNLAEMSESVRLVMVRHHGRALAGLVKTFSSARGNAVEADSIEASQANVAYGYLAVLLGNVCQTDEGRKSICAEMPGRSAGPLVEAIEEFIMHHKAVDQQGKSEVWATFTGRLQGVADRLRD